MRWGPQDYVAFLLAVVILVVFVGLMAKDIFVTPEVKWSEVELKIVENLLFTIIGGLVGYIAGGKNASP